MNRTRTSLMITALLLASLNLRPAINSVSPILANLRHDLGMSASLASLLTSIPVLCMGIFSPFAAKLGGRFGIENVLGGALALIGLGTVLRLFTGSAAFLLLTAFVAGVGIAATGPLLSGFIKRHFSGQVPLMISLYSVALSLGAALASGMTAPILARTQSWQTALGVWALFALLAVPVWWYAVLRRNRQTAAVSAARKASAFPWRNRSAWFLTLSFGLMSAMFYSIVAWLPPMIEDLGYGKVYAGNVLTVFAFIQVPVVLALPLIMKRFPSRLRLLLIFTAAELAGFILIGFGIQPLLAGALLGIGAGAIFPLSLLLPIEATSTPQEAATWSSMNQSVGYIIGAAGPLLLGWIHDGTGSFRISIAGLIAMNLTLMLIFVIVVPGIMKRKAQAA